jgi:TRAP-type C4-dicarboxylate transport system permease small subunit
MRVQRQIERLAIFACAIALFVVMALGAGDIALGELFGTYLPFKVDLSGMLLAVSLFLAWPLAQRNREHIRVDLFLQHFPPAVRRLSRWLSLACALLVFGLVAYGAWVLALESVAIRESSAATLGFPIYPAKLACAVGATLVVAVILQQLWDELRGRGDDAGS